MGTSFSWRQDGKYKFNYTKVTNHSEKKPVPKYVFVPRPKSNFMKRTLYYSGTILWNVLPSRLKTIYTCNIFIVIVIVIIVDSPVSH